MSRAALSVMISLGLLASGSCATSDDQFSDAPPSRPLGPTSYDPELEAYGREVVVRECSACHAIDQNTLSARSGAPAMRAILKRYDPEILANDLIEGIRVGHEEMPLFDFNVIVADAVISYLKSIEPHSSGIGSREPRQ